jgi:hypothetical protein
VRLTLRTLLAYLDDTLEPTEIRQIGQKVAESDAAQELIARIKQITRRRRLTTPPLTGPGAANFDPNTVAEYLDNALSTEQLAEVEKLCLESDVHLAEIATCHQILTLVLGEPALVPPTARERMYGLVQGKESIPFRKAAITTAPAAAANAMNGAGDDDDSPLGLTLMRRGGWPRWALPAAGVLLVVALVLTLFKVIPDANSGRQVASNNTAKKPDAETPAPVQETPADKPKTEPTKETPPPPADPAANKGKSAEVNVADKGTTSPAPAVKSEPAKTTEAQPQPKQPQTAAPQVSTEQTGAPSTERREVGTYTVSPRSGPTLLVQRQGEQGLWRRLAPGTRIYSTDPLVSLPGYLSEVRLDGGVHLQMRGLIPAFATESMMNFLFDSAVVIHPSKDVDLDFTLTRGRTYISNHKGQGEAKIRIRFDREIWLLTLSEPDSEVIVELMRHYVGDIRWREGEEPLTQVFLGFLKGNGSLKVDYNAFPMEMPGRAFCGWDNKRGSVFGPMSLQKPFPQWDKSPPMNKEADEMSVALEDLSKRMTDKKLVDVVLAEGLQADRFSTRLVSIYALGALDEVRRLLDILGDEDGTRAADRSETVWVLRRWLSRGPQTGKQLYDLETHTGLLTENKKYLSGEAETMLKLLYGFTAAERRSPEEYRALADYLRSSKIAIRELAIDDLIQQMGANLKYNPAWPDAERKKAAAELEKMVDEHKLPPPQNSAPRAPRGGPPPGNGK